MANLKNKNLTKSLAMIGLEFPRKLYYHNNPQIYQNNNSNDPFLQALAEGGFQVSALAKLYYPEGISLANLDLEDAIANTKELLLQDRVTIFEAAFMYNNLLIRTDLLIKEGDKIKLLEVKAKSYDPAKDSFFDVKTKQRLLKPWVPYLQAPQAQTGYTSKNN